MRVDLYLVSAGYFASRSMAQSAIAEGNVYLDGRTVGQVISDIQGNQYRTLQRSGWMQ